MNNFLGALILGTTISLTGCNEINSENESNNNIKNSYSEKSEYSKRLSKKEKESLVEDHVHLSYQYDTKDLDIESECTRGFNNFDNGDKYLRKVEIIIDGNDENNQIIREIIEENLRMYKHSLFKKNLKILVLGEKEYKKRKLYGLGITRKEGNGKLTIFIKKESFSTTTLHHELMHYFQFQTTSDLNSINEVIDKINDRYLNIFRFGKEEGRELFVSDYSTKNLGEDAATLHESFMMQENNFLSKLKESEGMKDKVESFYGIKLDKESLEEGRILIEEDINEDEYYSLYGIKKNSHNSGAAMFKELDKDSLNKVQEIRNKINKCIETVKKEKIIDKERTIDS